jgi:hypothetical protein
MLSRAGVEIGLHHKLLMMTTKVLATYMSSSRPALDDWRRLAVARQKDMLASAK